MRSFSTSSRWPRFWRLGNVLGFFDHRRAVAQLVAHSALDAEALDRAVYGGDAMDDYESGAITTAEFFAASRVAGRLTCSQAEFVRAFADMPDKKLVVIGSGPEFQKIKSLAGDNVTLLGHQSFDALQGHMRNARAFIFAAEEDFGITPVEAQACGTPVIAFGKGGSRETVIPGKTGLFFNEQTPGSIARAVAEFEISSGSFDPVRIRQHAEQFSSAAFRSRLATFAEHSWKRFQAEIQDSVLEVHPLAGQLNFPPMSGN